MDIGQVSNSDMLSVVKTRESRLRLLVGLTVYWFEIENKVRCDFYSSKFPSVPIAQRRKLFGKCPGEM